MSLQCHGINLKFLHVQNRIYIKFKIKSTVTHAYISVETTAIQANRRLYKRRFDDCTSVDSTVVRAPIRRLHKRRIDVCTRVQLAILQASIWQFRKRRFDGCTSVVLTVVQALDQQLNKRRIDGYNRRIDSYNNYFKKGIKIFRCPFTATVKMIPFRTSGFETFYTDEIYDFVDCRIDIF